MHVAEPWERRCGACDGIGRVMSLAWAAWHEEYGNRERIADLPTRLHALAEHVRRVPSEADAMVCPECGGEGVVVTELGAALLDFLNRRLEPPPAPQPEPPAHQPPTWDGRQDGSAASYYERPTQPSMAAQPHSPAPASVAATPDWRLHAPPNAVAARDPRAQSNGPPAWGTGDPSRSRPRPEWRAHDWD